MSAEGRAFLPGGRRPRRGGRPGHRSGPQRRYASGRARLRPQIDWRQGDATALPFEDGSFDAVLSQFALMYFPDRIVALTEMVRVLRPGGRLTIAVWGPFERATSYVILTEISRQRCGQTAADVLTAPFALGDKDLLMDLCKAAGINEAVIALREGP